MTYKFDQIDIAFYGVLPRRDESGLALSGMLDFPKRNGTTEHNWGTQIEPYVTDRDLSFEGRTLNMKLVMPDLVHLGKFSQAWMNCKMLGTEWGDFNVIAANEMTVEKIGERMGLIGISFLQASVEPPILDLAGSGGTGYRIDDWHLEHDLGIRVAAVTDDLNFPKRIDVGTSDVYTETRYRENGKLTLDCVMQSINSARMVRQMGQLHAICALPGLRQLQFPDGNKREMYVKDGFKVSMDGNCVARFSLKMEML